MFHPMDLVAPIGLSIIAAALCTWGFVKAKNFPARLVCALTAALFLSSNVFLYVMRYHSRKADYTTQQGVRVRQGTKGQCEKENVTTAVQWVLDFWTKQCPDRAGAVNEAVDDRLLVCLDIEKISTPGRFVRGYTFGSTAVVGYNGEQSYTDSLIKHELSHSAATGCGYPLDEAKHHELFKRVGLGH